MWNFLCELSSGHPFVFLLLFLLVAFQAVMSIFYRIADSRDDERDTF